jgi:hypothetical protein
MIHALNDFVRGVTKKDNATALLFQVQEIVFGTSDITKRNWNTQFRIDDFDFTKEGLRLSVGDGALRTVHRFTVTFEESQKLQLIA